MRSSARRTTGSLAASRGLTPAGAGQPRSSHDPSRMSTAAPRLLPAAPAALDPKHGLPPARQDPTTTRRAIARASHRLTGARSIPSIQRMKVAAGPTQSRRHSDRRRQSRNINSRCWTRTGSGDRRASDGGASEKNGTDSEATPTKNTNYRMARPAISSRPRRRRGAGPRRTSHRRLPAPSTRCRPGRGCECRRDHGL